MKIRPFGTELFLKDGDTGRQDKANIEWLFAILRRRLKTLSIVIIELKSRDTPCGQNSNYFLFKCVTELVTIFLQWLKIEL